MQPLRKHALVNKFTTEGHEVLSQEGIKAYPGEPRTLVA